MAVPLKSQTFLPCADLPETNAEVVAAGSQRPAVGREAHRANNAVLMPCEPPHFLARVRVPQMNRVVLGCRGYHFAVGGIGDAPQPAFMAAKLAKLLTGREIPKANG